MNYESYLRAWQQHRDTRTDAKASHERHQTAGDEKENDIEKDKRATGPNTAQERRGWDLEHP